MTTCTTTCTASLTDRDTVIPCEGYHSGSRHYAEFFGAVYSWEAGAEAFQVWPLFENDGWQDVAATGMVLSG